MPFREFGRTGGGVESYTIRSGTNQIHGAAYDYIRNEAFDARGFYPAKRGVYKQHDMGASVGGPVVIPKLYNGKDKTFFFFKLRSVPAGQHRRQHGGHGADPENAAGHLH